MTGIDFTKKFKSKEEATESFNKILGKYDLEWEVCEWNKKIAVKIGAFHFITTGELIAYECGFRNGFFRLKGLVIDKFNQTIKGDKKCIM